MPVSDTDRTKIKEHYMKGQGSIQDLARIYRYSVEEILEVVGEQHLGQIQTGGDMISPSEAGPGAKMNYGENVRVPFTTD